MLKSLKSLHIAIVSWVVNNKVADDVLMLGVSASTNMIRGLNVDVIF